VLVAPVLTSVRVRDRDGLHHGSVILLIDVLFYSLFYYFLAVLSAEVLFVKITLNLFRSSISTIHFSMNE
jgi:hypothetical protein